MPKPRCGTLEPPHQKAERRSSIANGLGQLQVICFTYGADKKESVENYLTFMAKIIVPISGSYGIHSFDQVFRTECGISLI